MKRFFHVAAFAGAALLVAACSGAGPPTTPADVRGVVTHVDRMGSTAMVRVEEAPADSAGSVKAVVTVEGDGVVWRMGGARGTVGDVRAGQVVRVWFAGPVAESYPVRARARAVVIEANAP